MMSPYLAKLKQLSHRRKMRNISLSLGQHLSQLERLDRELAMARQQETKFYTKYDIENDPEMETEELEGPGSDTTSSNSTSTSTSTSNSTRNSSRSTNSTSGDQQGQGHGPGIGFDQLKLDQAQVQVHCADDPAPGESGDCLAIKETGIKCRLTINVEENKDLEQPLLKEVPSSLECRNTKFPLPTAAAIKLASKSKLNADAVAYEMRPKSESPAPVSVPTPTSTPPFRLNAMAPIFKPAKEFQEDLCSDLHASGTIAAAAAGAEATYQLLMRQLTMLHQPPDPLAHIHPLHPYSQAQAQAQAQSLIMPHNQVQLQLPATRPYLLPTPAIQPNVQANFQHQSIPESASQSLLGIPEHLLQRIISKQHLRPRKEPLPDLFPEVLTLMSELLRPVSYPEIVNILAARLHRPVVELKRHIPHTLHAAVIHGYLSKDGNRYSMLSETEHMEIKRRNHDAAKRAKELEKEPLSWRKR